MRFLKITPMKMLKDVEEEIIKKRERRIKILLMHVNVVMNMVL